MLVRTLHFLTQLILFYLDQGSPLRKTATFALSPILLNGAIFSTDQNCMQFLGFLNIELLVMLNTPKN